MNAHLCMPMYYVNTPACMSVFMGVYMCMQTCVHKNSSKHQQAQTFASVVATSLHVVASVRNTDLCSHVPAHCELRIKNFYLLNR